MAWTADSVDAYYSNLLDRAAAKGVSTEDILLSDIGNSNAGFDWTTEQIEAYKSQFDTPTKMAYVEQIAGAKNTGNTKLEKVLDTIFKYGGQVVDLLATAGVFGSNFSKVDVLKPNTIKENLDPLALETLINNAKSKVEEKTTPPPTNSTYFGIDFSNPLTWVVAALAIWGLYKLFNQVPVTTAQPVYQQAKRR